MQRIENWSGVQAVSYEREDLPIGGYVCRIMKAEEIRKTGKSGVPYSQLALSFDIEEGPYKGFFAAQYRAGKGYENNRWKGEIRVFCPTPGQDDKAIRSQGRFKAVTNAIEASNPHYQWDWDELGLKGKLIGVMFRREEYDFKGYHGFSSRPYRIVDIEYVRRGDYPPPKDKRLDASQSSSNAPASIDIQYEDVIDEDLPF